MAILLLGTVFENPAPGSSRGVTWPVYVVYGLVLCHLPIAIILLMKLSGARWLAASMSALAAWSSFWGAFVSVMSITGDWI